MATTVKKVEVWAAEVADRPGGLARVLEALSEAGASAECVIARRQPDRPGSGVVFVTPVRGKKAQDAARSAGLAPAQHIATLRVQGPDRAGVGAALSRAMAEEGINLRGLSCAVLGKTYVAYFGFDSDADADRAAAAIRSASTRSARPTGARRAKRKR
jgi:hypothetical protein